jgi:hypothetical protein
LVGFRDRLCRSYKKTHNKSLMLNGINDFLKQPMPLRVLFFDIMLTLSLIQVLYWLGLLTVLWSGVGHFFSNVFFMSKGLVYVVGLAIALRVLAELVVLLFKINQNLEKIVGSTDLRIDADASVLES